MSQDSIAWIENQEARHLARLAKMVPNPRPVIMEALRDIYTKRLARSMEITAIALGVFMLYWFFSQPNLFQSPNFLIHLCSLLGGIFVPFLTVFLVRAVKVPNMIVNRVWSIPMDASEIAQLREMIEKCPQIQEVCVKWAATTDNLTLGSVEFGKIERVYKEVDVLRLQLLGHQRYQDMARASMEDLGLLSKITAQREHSQLQAQTVECTTTKPPSRL